MDRLATLVLRRPRALLALGALLVVLAAALGAGVFGALKTGGFEDPAAESALARDQLAERFGVQAPDLLVLVTAAQGTSGVDDPAVGAAARGLTDQVLAQPGTEVLASYWDLPPGAPPAATAGLRSTDGRQGLVVLALAGDEAQVEERAAALEPLLDADLGAATARPGGLQQANLDIGSTVEADLARAEALAVPLTLALLLVVFASVVAGLLPLLVGGVAIIGTFAALAAVASVTDVSVFALNLTTALGIGLGVDYALLVVSRFREECATGADTPAAIRTTLRTAGRTIGFSAATVAVALSALLVFPVYFLRSFAYAGIAVVAVAGVTALVGLPALLTVLGPRRLEKGRLPFLRRRATASPSGSGLWHRVATVVMRRPVLTAAPVLALLAVMAAPLAGVQFGLPDDRAVNAGAETSSRAVGDVLRAGFSSADTSALRVVLPGTPATDAELTPYAADLSRLPGVTEVVAPAGTLAQGSVTGAPLPGATGSDADGTFLSVVPAVDVNSPAAEDLVDAVRALPAPGEALVAGPSAELVDGKEAIGSRLWVAGLLVVGSTLVLLFAFTGSVVLPVKAVLLNVATIGGVIGAMVWVFQEGNLSGLLGFTPGPLYTAMPVLLFCIAFGLSMDYELFLLGRIREEHLAGADTRTAVALGLERTGRIVTSAALLLCITFFAFTTSDVSFIQLFGLGTGLAIVLDATLVRGVLVPAIMRLMGDASWWAPGPLRRLHDRFGLREGSTGGEPPSGVDGAQEQARVPVAL